MIVMIKNNLLNLMKQYYLDLAFEEEEEEEDSGITVETLEIDGNGDFLMFVKAYYEDIVYDFISERMGIDESELLNLEVNYLPEENIIKIDVQEIEIEEDSERSEEIPLLDMEKIRKALLMNKFDEAQSLFEKYVKRENNRLVAEKETSFFTWEISVKLEDLKGINVLESKLLDCIKLFEESEKSESFEF